MENKKELKKGIGKKTRLLLHHLRPAASAFAVGVLASFAATILKTVFTQVIRFTVDGVLLGETAGLPAWLAALEPGKMLAASCALAAVVAVVLVAAVVAATVATVAAATVATLALLVLLGLDSL